MTIKVYLFIKTWKTDYYNDGDLWAVLSEKTGQAMVPHWLSPPDNYYEWSDLDCLINVFDKTRIAT